MRFATEQLIRFGEAQADAGTDLIVISDPSGTGEILGSKYFEDYVVRSLNRIIDALHGKNVPMIVHICGRCAAYTVRSGYSARTR